jgi:hypothetical protein
MAFFGFIPSESLLNKIQTAIAQKNSKEPLYPLRDEIALQVNDEIIDAIVTNLIHHFLKQINVRPLKNWQVLSNPVCTFYCLSNY